jgi:hypothetical protein
MTVTVINYNLVASNNINHDYIKQIPLYYDFF